MRKTLWLIFIFVPLIFVGCPVALNIIFYNHTGYDIEIGANNKEVFILKSNSGKLMDFTLTPTFPVAITGKTKAGGIFVWRYHLVAPPKEYIRPIFGGIKGYEILFQIESNGHVYLLPPESQLPTLQFEDQPKGFPLMPL